MYGRTYVHLYIIHTYIFLFKVVSALISACKVDDNKINAGLYAEGRRNSIGALLR